MDIKHYLHIWFTMVLTGPTSIYIGKQCIPDIDPWFYIYAIGKCLNGLPWLFNGC